MATEKDYYQILGVSKSATADEIKRSYRKLALEFHPDRNKTKEADAKFKEVTKAYEVLSSSEKRKTYDQFGHSAFEQGGFGSAGGAGPFGQGGPFGGASGGQQGGQYGPFSYSYSSSGGQGGDFGGFTDPFEIFEQFFGGQSPFGTRNRRAVYSLTISFDDAVHGAEKQVNINNKSQKIKIPPGVDTGSRMRFGDYDVVFEVRGDPKFVREGYDIVSEKELSFVDAALGGEFDVETIDGNIKIRIPEGTQPAALIRLKGRGVPHVRGSGRGDHYLRIKVTVPTKLNRKQKEILETLKKEEENSAKGWF